MNEKVLYIRVFGQLVSVGDVTLVQVNPNNAQEVVQEIALTRPLEDLVEYNLGAFARVHETRAEWAEANA